MIHRRVIFRWAALGLGNALALALAVPGVRYLLDPLGRRSGSSDTRSLTRLSQLKVGEPQSFAVIARRQDSWVRYPPEPVGLVWLIRQAEGVSPPVLALSAECPHLSCPVNLAPDRRSFLCPCHQASFRLDGATLNTVSPRAMDSLAVSLGEGADPEVLVRFERYQPQTSEKKPLV